MKLKDLKTLLDEHYEDRKELKKILNSVGLWLNWELINVILVLAETKKNIKFLKSISKDCTVTL